MSRPRVLHFTPFGDLAGANRSCLTLMQEQAQRGPVCAVTLEEGDFAQAAREAQVDVRIALPAQSGRASRWRRWSGTVQTLRRAISEWQIDLVHCHSARGVRFAWPAVVGTAAQLVTHQRDNYCRDYFHLGLGRSNHIIAISEWVKQALPSRMQAKATVVYNAVKLPPADMAVASREQGPITIGLAGRCRPEKGMDLLLEALPALPLDTDFEVQLWGISADDRDPYTMQLHSIVNQYRDDLRGRVHFEPFRADIDQFYASSDIVVVPSRYAEPFGRVAIEAMAWRRPVIVAGRGGLLEIVDHGRTGLVFRPDDSADLAEKLRQLVTDPTLRTRLANAGREEVERRFLPEPHAAAIDEVYLKLTSQGRS